jgi:hypothetical protein
MFSEEPITERPNFNVNIENARVLIEDAPWRDNPEKYRKVAEGILRRILTVDPKNEAAKRLLLKAVAGVPKPAPPKAKTPVRPGPAAVKPHPVMKPQRPATAPHPRPVSSELPFVVQKVKPPSPAEKKKRASSPWGVVAFTAVVAVIVATLMFIMVQPR